MTLTYDEKVAPTLWSVESRPQAEVLRDLVRICWPGHESLLDPTWGSGKFYPFGDFQPTFASDGHADRARDAQHDFTKLPHPDRAFDVVVFDPPFQPATVDGIIGERFTKPVRGIADLERLVRAGAAECWRVARRGLVIKVQDYIHDHKPVWMSRWLWSELGEPYEVVHVTRKAKLKATNWSRQLSAYRNHSTFWAFSREKNR